MKKIAFLVLWSLLCCTLLFPEAKIGSVQSISGDVALDAFGKGSFIPAILGDALYPGSVVRTGGNGRATLMLNNEAKEVPPGALVKVAELSAASSKKQQQKWFAALGNVIRSLTEAAQTKETDLVLGSRAADVSSNDNGDMDWEVEETDASVILPKAQKAIETANYASALEQLGKAEPPTNAALAWKLSFWRGFCYYQVDDFGDAAAHLAAAWSLTEASNPPPEEAASRSALPFLLGSSWFMLGQEKTALPFLDQYLAQDPQGRYAPYSTLLLAKALASTGNRTRSRSVAVEGARKYKGTDLESEFTTMAQ
jgi:hypothetical protein